MKDQKVDWLYLPPDSYLGTQAKASSFRGDGRRASTFASTEQLMETGALTGLISR